MSLRLICAFPSAESSRQASAAFLGNHFLSFLLWTEFLYLGANANWGSWPLASKGTSHGPGGIVHICSVVSTAFLLRHVRSPRYVSSACSLAERMLSPRFNFPLFPLLTFYVPVLACWSSAEQFQYLLRTPPILPVSVCQGMGLCSVCFSSEIGPNDLLNFPKCKDLLKTLSKKKITRLPGPGFREGTSVRVVFFSF